jgi:ABC transporter with metal-binding/Fe-S-binding domain ATP-binding protein|tara:strand:- start:523 stop:1197 length:675 start_codon:yes stop_codon:yes gene_type:complete
MKSKKCAVLFSGGKDSCLALHKAKLAGYEVRYLLSIIPENFDSFMFHKPYLELLERQAEELDVDLIVEGSKGEEEKEVNDLRELILKIKDDVDGIVVGGIASDYQGSRIKKICDEFKLEFIAPLLSYKSEDVWKELLDEGFEVILTKIASEGLGKEWIGKIITNENFKELEKLGEKYKFRIDFEGGEAESAVLFMPEFKNKIKIDFDVKEEGRYRSFVDNLKVL